MHTYAQRVLDFTYNTCIEYMRIAGALEGWVPDGKGRGRIAQGKEPLARTKRCPSPALANQRARRRVGEEKESER